MNGMKLTSPIEKMQCPTGERCKMKKEAAIFISLMTLYPIACSAEQSSKPAVTYDKLDKSKTWDLELSTDVNVSDSSRISTMTEHYFCENQTLEVNLSRRFESKKRIAVDLSVEKNGEKLSREEISKASNAIEDYRFYDMDFSCVNGYFGVKITGYTLGLNGSRPSSEVFNYHVYLESGEILEFK